MNPPAGRIEAIVGVELAFLKELAGKLPALAVSDVKVESKGGGLFEIKAVVTNEGYLPTAMAQGVRTRQAPPVLVRLKAGNASFLIQHRPGVRHAKLMVACGCKSHPVKAVAGRLGSSLAGVAATRGLKCRQRPCGVWDRTSKV